MKEPQRQFQGGNQISSIPSQSGLYAWYYKPLITDSDSLSKSIISFFDDKANIASEINLRYGVKLKANTSLQTLYGTQNQEIAEIIQDALKFGEKFILEFFRSELVCLFTKPIYIGVAQDFYTRVYEQHYLSLDKMWNDNSHISKYLAIDPNATVQKVMDRLNVSHTFALEARVRQIAPRDLMVTIFPTDQIPIGIDIDEGEDQDESKHRKNLEKLLQVIADPICGRR